jgi:hypothetical protein
MPEVAAASAIVNPPPGPAPADMTREQALARHQQIMSDPAMDDWRAEFVKGDTTKREELAALHRRIEQLDPENLAGTQAARVALEREKFVDHVRNTADIPEPVADMIRNDTPVSAREHRMAEQERGRLLADPKFRTAWLAGERDAKTRLALVDAVLARPVIRTAAA